MRLSHTELEEVKDDPAEWVRKKRAGGGFRIGGYDTILKDAIYRYHKSAAEDTDEIRSYILSRLDTRNFRNASKRASVMEKLNAYVNWYLTSDTLVFDTRYRLNYTIIDEFAFGGLVSRLDMTSTGYRAILLGNHDNSWQQELRMPLIQRAVALATKRSENEMLVGVQNLDGSRLATTQYSSSDIDSAERLFIELLLTVDRENEALDDTGE